MTMIGKGPLVSVIIPVYNGGKFLAEAADSVLAQGVSSLELIVVDDGSTDDTREIAGELPGVIVYEYQENQGPAAARNHGLKLARGDLIAFQDVDDIWPPGRLAAQLSCLSKNPGVDIVTGLVQCLRPVVSDNGSVDWSPWEEPWFFNSIPASVFRKSTFDVLAGFNETLRYGEDSDFFLRAREQGLTVAKLPLITLFYRLHENNMTHGKSPRDLNVLQVLKLSIHRRRRAGQGRAADLTPIVEMDSTGRKTGPDDPHDR